MIKKNSVYSKLLFCENHHSPNLIKFFKRRENQELRFLQVQRDGESLAKMKKQKIKEMDLHVGYRAIDQWGKKPVKITALTCTSIGRILCNNKPYLNNIVGFNNVWCIDVTDKVIEEYLEKGMCAFHDMRHEFKKINTKRRKCLYCGQEQKMRIQVVKTEKWENYE